MFKITVLFSVLAALAHAKPTGAKVVQRDLLGGGGGGLLGGLGDAGGLLGGLTGSHADYNHFRGHGHNHVPAFRNGDDCYAGGRWGHFQDLLCVVADVGIAKRGGTPYGFGWFHPGAFQDGDRCWQHDRAGVINDALCIVADLDISARHQFGGWFTEPYYGYGHRFGWYHPGPFIEGDRCWQDGYAGTVQNAICLIVDADLDLHGLGLNGAGLGKRDFYGPNYWYEPYFAPGYNFGWFHNGPFANGDRCWKEGHYGSILDSLCVILKQKADLDLDLKRDLGGLGGLGGLTDILDLGSGTSRHGKYRYREGDRCAQASQWGYWRGNSCDLDVDAIITKRDGFIPSNLLHGDHRLGHDAPCFRNGQAGVLRDGLCLIADLDVVLGRRSNGVAEGVESTWEAATGATSDSAENVEMVEDGSEHEAEFEERSLLGYAPGQNKGNALGKIVHEVLADVKTRNVAKRFMAPGPAVMRHRGLGGLGGLGAIGGLTGGGKGQGKADPVGSLVGGVLQH